jgi:hypothetical protein
MGFIASILIMLIYWVRNINNINKNTEAISDTSKSIGLEVNMESTKYMFVSHHWNAGQTII